MNYLLDSVILMDYFNGILDASTFISKRARTIKLLVITRAEVLIGFSAAQRKFPKQLLDAFSTLGIDAAVADLAADLRYQYRWKLPDALQAVIALNHNLFLESRNTKDFSPNRHNFVFVPYEI